MKVSLISAPTITEFSRRQITESQMAPLLGEHIPLGILSLAAVLEDQGYAPSIVDLNQLYYDSVIGSDAGLPEALFFSVAVGQLTLEASDVFGFSTICNSFPLTLRLAREVKRVYPKAKILLGGPQASVVDASTLKNFSFIDFILRGEAEHTLPLLLDTIASGATDYSHIGGLSYHRKREVVRNSNAPVIEDLDSLPLPAFHLYQRIHECGYATLEAGRGCPFACSFCSTNDFFRRRFRMKSPETLLTQMRRLNQLYGMTSFDLVHDMFTVDRKKVLAYCDALENANENFEWSCSARTDCVDDELLSRMARAGCRGLFFGIDSGSDRIQEQINKRLNMVEAANHIKSASRNGMKTTVSLITGFPEETRDDLLGTIKFFGESLRHKRTELQLHLLAPLAETPITTRYKDELVYDDIFSDMSFQGWDQAAEDRALIVAHPDVFTNFYAVPMRYLDRLYIKDLREFLMMSVSNCRLLLLLLHLDAGDLVRVFDEWASWRKSEEHRSEFSAKGISRHDIERFPKNFCDFICTQYAPTASRYPHLVATMAEMECALRTVKAAPKQSLRSSKEIIVQLSENTIPVMADGVEIVQTRANYKRLLRCLKRGERLDRIPAESSIFAVAPLAEQIKILQLNDRTHQFLRLCDGSRNIAHLSETMPEIETIKGMPPTSVCLYALRSLHHKGLVTFQAGV